MPSSNEIQCILSNRSGVVAEEDKGAMAQFQNQMLTQAPNASFIDVKQENSGNSYVYGHGNEELHSAKSCWSPKSCVTSFSSNMLDFSNNNRDHVRLHPPPDLSSEVRKRLDFIAPWIN